MKRLFANVLAMRARPHPSPHNPSFPLPGWEREGGTRRAWRGAGGKGEGVSRTITGTVTRLAFAAMLLLALAACAPQAAALPTASPVPPAATVTITTTATPTMLPTATATLTPSPTIAPSPTPSPTPCAAEICVLPWRFPLLRPIPPSGNSAIAPTYRFGDDYHGLYLVHHGVDMDNPAGTPVLAAADGEVVFAGSDAEQAIGLHPNFYGNVVVLKHNPTAMGFPLWTVYGHMETVTVHVGQTVKAGEIIGTVGSRGIATGPHLHFEVRLGSTDYDAVQNPELWLQPPSPNQGAIAMRLIDAAGKPLCLTNVLVRGLTEELPTFYLKTYADPTLPSDPRLHENLAAGSIPAGHYAVEITCCGRLFRREIVVQPRHLTFLQLILPQH